MNRDGRCRTCDGDGFWCGQHDTPDGCDCEDEARTVPCEDCGGTGLSSDDDDDEPLYCDGCGQGVGPSGCGCDRE